MHGEIIFAALLKLRNTGNTTMPAYARNHYLAASHLRRFCRPDGKIVVSQRDPQEPTCERKPESAGYGKYWYGRTCRKEKENALKVVEDEAIKWMNQIEKSGITPDFPTTSTT